MTESIAHYGALPAPSNRSVERAGLRRRGSARRLVRRYLDTPDRRLFRAGTALEIDEEAGHCHLRWRNLGSGTVRHSTRLTAVPGTAADLEAGAFRDELIAATRGRILHAIVGEALDVVSYSCPDLDCSLDVESSRPEYELDVEPPVWRIRVSGPSTRELEARLAALGCESSTDPLLGLLQGQQIVQPLERKVARIDPSSPCLAVALAGVTGSLLDRIEAQEPGIFEDADPEFLHEFRVTCRRMRSLFQDTARPLPKRLRKRLREDFRWLSLLTGPLRDLDVLLAHFDGLEPAAPARVYEALVRQRLNRAHAVQEALRSERYRRFKRLWRKCLARLQADSHDDSDLRTAAVQLLETTYARTLAQLHRLERELGFDAFHELRKCCKRLRYRLDACRPLLVASEARAVIAALKLLQDALGEINDRETQERIITEARGALAGEADTEAARHWAVRLLTELGRAKTQGLADIRPELAKFASPANQDRFHRMLAPTG